MRVTYGREMAVKSFLDSINVETFLPMTDHTWREGKSIKHKRVPAISNLIFVHDRRNHITELKHTRREAEPLRYMMRQTVSGKELVAEVIVVPDRQMDNFMRVAEGPEEQRTFLAAEDLKGHDGARVVITSGPFAGVEGVIKRVKGNKRVTIKIDGVGGVCINFVPKTFILKVE